MEKGEMAGRTTILRATVGSTVHGLALEAGDRDEMGVCVEDLGGFGGFTEFDQYIYRSATERTGKTDAPSEKGDLDLTLYGLRKFLRLALHGNPTVLTLLFVPPESCQVLTSEGKELQDLAPHILSRQAGKRFLGYMEAQRQRLLGERGQKKTNRPVLEEAHGYDTKYAMHILRLGYQGIELLETGKLILPMEGITKEFLLRVRRGEVPLDEVLTVAGNLERGLKDLLDTSPLPENPDTPYVEGWMLETYFNAWTGSSR